jgi:hypothetical protein
MESGLFKSLYSDNIDNFNEQKRIQDSNKDLLDSYSRPLPNPPPGKYWLKEEDNSWSLNDFLGKDIEENTTEFTTTNSSVIEHVVIPGIDTLQGICLRYHVSAIELRRTNLFSGNNINQCKSLRIPLERGVTISRQDDNSYDILLQRFRNETTEGIKESKFYIDEYKNYDKAIKAWKGDKKWENELPPVLSSSPKIDPVSPINAHVNSEKYLPPKSKDIEYNQVEMTLKNE